jgi:cobalt-zinc-cadmium efflux system protein
MRHAPVEGRSAHGHCSHATPAESGPRGGAGQEDLHALPAPHTHSVSGMEGHRPRQRKALFWSLILTVLMMIGEVIAGIWTGSLMLLSDAIHMFSHAISLTVSWVAIWIACKPLTARAHYGNFRFEILASLFNGCGLLVLCSWILFESVERVLSPLEVASGELIAVALIGLLVNIATAWILSRSGAEDLNTKSALLHMLGDLLSSVVIVLGGIVLWFTDWVWLDPLLSGLVACLVGWWGIGLVRASASILLERTPKGVRLEEGENVMQSAAPGIREVHDQHIWEITSGYVCLTAHVVVDDSRLSETDAVRSALCEALWTRYQVVHVTLQLEAA